MSTLPMQAPSVPHIWPLTGFGRVVAVLATALEVIAEAQQQARAAHKRYPFADW